MATIIERTVAGETDKRIVLTKEQMGRSISIGSNWQKIRIGFRHSMTANYLPVTGYLSFGMCSGTTNMIQDETTEHFIGIKTPSINWESQSVQPNGISCGGVDWNFIKKKDNTITAYDKLIQDDQNNRFILPGSRWDTGFSAWFIELHKKPINWEWKIYSPTRNNNMGNNIDYQKFISSINNDVVPTSGSFFRYTCSGIIAVNEEEDGYLDTINIAWQGITDQMEISDVAYSIIE